MKKILLFVIVASAFTFASCKKDRTCTCVYSSTSNGVTVSSTEVTIYPDSKKHDASLYCVSSSQTQANGDKDEAICTLK